MSSTTIRHCVPSSLVSIARHSRAISLWTSFRRGHQISGRDSSPMITCCSLCVPTRSTGWLCGIRRAHAFLHCESNYQPRYGAVIIDVVYREIHLSDLIRAHEGNPDYQDDDPSKIHWAKFNMMARFIDVITQCQDGCRATEQFRDLERLRLQEPWYLRWENDTMLMSLEVGLLFDLHG